MRASPPTAREHAGGGSVSAMPSNTATARARGAGELRAGPTMSQERIGRSGAARRELGAAGGAENLRETARFPGNAAIAVSSVAVTAEETTSATPSGRPSVLLASASDAVEAVRADHAPAASVSFAFCSCARNRRRIGAALRRATSGGPLPAFGTGMRCAARRDTLASRRLVFLAYAGRSSGAPSSTFRSRRDLNLSRYRY